jgi:arsenite methyltransferase
MKILSDIADITDKHDLAVFDSEVSRLCRALGHPHRVAILRFLKERSACICGEIVEMLPVAQSTVSQHLKTLKEAGWVTGEIEGPRTCYCLHPGSLDRFRTLVTALTSTLEINMDNPDGIRAVVRDRYGKAVETAGCGCGGGTCCGGAADAADISQQIGYRLEDLNAVPAGSNLGLGCGNPFDAAQIQAGEVVLDLGSGAGLDCFLAVRAMGAGNAIGVDMTPQMIEKARSNAREAGITNVEFRLGEIEHLPVADNSVDVIISNCVINLSPDKPQVFREALRVLKPGGRMLVSDLVLRRPLSPQLKNSVEAYVGCVAGASKKEEYLQLMRDAGLADVKIVSENIYDIGLGDIGDDLNHEALEAVVSVKVRAVKPV